MDRASEIPKGTTGLELTELNWLYDHHKTKEIERQQMVVDLELKSGDKVLDLGCGPGLWTQMLAEQVLPNGLVVGLDFDSHLIDFAQKQLIEADRYANTVQYKVGDFHETPFEDGFFDLVFFGNCFAYLTDFHKALQEQKRITKVGGRVAAKDFDGAIIIFHPIDPVLQNKVLTATATGLRDNPPKPFFNNYTGRNLHGLFLQEKFINVTTKSYAVQKLFPLSPEAKRYISGNAKWYAKMGADYLSETELKQWDAHFDPDSADYILDRDDFYFCMLEVVTIGTVDSK